MTPSEYALATCCISLAVMMTSAVWVVVWPSWTPVVLIGVGAAIYSVAQVIYSGASLWERLNGR